MFASFDAKGRIVQFQSKDEVFGQAVGCISCPEIVDVKTFYVFNSELVSRPEIPSVDLSDLSNMPDGSEIVIRNEDGDSITVGPQDQVSLVDPGVYVVSVNFWPYRDFRKEIVVD